MIQNGIWKSRLISSAVLAAALASCAAGPQTGPYTPPIAGPIEAPETPTETGPIDFASSGHKGLDDWRIGFAAKMLEAGHDRALVTALLSDLEPISMYLGSDFQAAATDIGDQAEFAKPIWDYLRVPMGNTRIEGGKAKLEEYDAVFDDLEARYGVNREVLIAIWGMETSYGGYIGNFHAANTLANMAVEGRRKTFAENELMALAKIVERGDAAADELVSGWAGAMGQTQFMPSTFLAYAADYEGDGHLDIWTNPPDALASAANYLSKSGYSMDQPWGIEVLAPAGFDYSLADGQDRRVTTWQTAGLMPMKGETFETNGADFAELWLPAGAQGPKYLLFHNFDVFKTYNRADSYAFAVGLVAQTVGGEAGPVAAWPTHLTPLTVAQIKELQAGLNGLGFNAGGVDGIAGRKTKAALQDFQKSRGLMADGYPTTEMLDLVLGGTGPS